VLDGGRLLSAQSPDEYAAPLRHAGAPRA